MSGRADNTAKLAPVLLLQFGIGLMLIGISWLLEPHSVARELVQGLNAFIQGAFCMWFQLKR